MGCPSCGVPVAGLVGWDDSEGRRFCSYECREKGVSEMVYRCARCSEPLKEPCWVITDDGQYCSRACVGMARTDPRNNPIWTSTDQVETGQAKPDCWSEKQIQELIETNRRLVDIIDFLTGPKPPVQVTPMMDKENA